MEDKPLGILRVHVKRGINLAIRDATTSDPYVVITLANQKLKTRVINNNCNPVWNEQLTLSIKDVNDPIRLVSYRVYYNLRRSSKETDCWLILWSVYADGV
jgi:Ca2+-dependent lipid-binding protein